MERPMKSLLIVYVILLNIYMTRLLKRHISQISWSDKDLFFFTNHMAGFVFLCLIRLQFNNLNLPSIWNTFNPLDFLAVYMPNPNQEILKAVYSDSLAALILSYILALIIYIIFLILHLFSKKRKA